MMIKNMSIMLAGAHSFADASYEQDFDGLSQPDPKMFPARPTHPVGGVLL